MSRWTKERGFLDSLGGRTGKWMDRWMDSKAAGEYGGCPAKKYGFIFEKLQ